jgi:hypothetical protein
MSDVDPIVSDPGPTDPPADSDTVSQEVIDNVVERWGWTDAEAAPEPAPEPEPAEDLTPPPAPGGPVLAPEGEGESEGASAPSVVRLPDGREFPLALIREWADRVPEPPPVAPPAPAAVQQPFYLPPVSEEDLEQAGPAVRALLIIANAQAQKQRELEEQISTNRQLVETRARQENAQIANAAATSFQRDHNLPDDLMSRIKDTVQVSDVEAFMRTTPDPYKAIEFALTRSYWNDKEARQYEFSRQMEVQQKALDRKRKLAGVGGNSGGSGPRGAEPAIEPGPDGWKKAAIAQVARDMGIQD